MKLPELKLNNLSKSAAEIITKIVSGKTRVVRSEVKNITPHIKVMGQLIVEGTKRKADYLPDIIELTKKGMSKKDIAKLFDMSESYVYKLLQKK